MCQIVYTPLSGNCIVKAGSLAIIASKTTTIVTSKCKEACINAGTSCAAYNYLQSGTVCKLYNSGTDELISNSQST